MSLPNSSALGTRPGMSYYCINYDLRDGDGTILHFPEATSQQHVPWRLGLIAFLYPHFTLKSAWPALLQHMTGHNNSHKVESVTHISVFCEKQMG